MADLCDFARSYLTFVAPDAPKPDNAARIQIDARAVVRGPDGRSIEYVLITPCKSEQMYVRPLFQKPNYDFCGVFSKDENLLIRTAAQVDPSREMEWAASPNASRFRAVKIDLRPAKGARPLTTAAEVVRATLANETLIARTRVADRAGGRSAILEYPVKTMNVCEGTGQFQVDTGPLLFPRWLAPGVVGRAPALGSTGAPPGDAEPPAPPAAIDQFALAFICYMDFTGGEVVLRQPTPVADGAASVQHYSRIVEIDATHELFAAE